MQAQGIELMIDEGRDDRIMIPAPYLQGFPPLPRWGVSHFWGVGGSAVWLTMFTALSDP